MFVMWFLFLFFKQKTAYEMRISDWSSDVCSSDLEGVMPTLAVHELKEGEPYLIGLFMVGAYQEILGDIHNLFGDTNAVNVVLDAKSPDGWHLEGAEQERKSVV